MFPKLTLLLALTPIFIGIARADDAAQTRARYAAVEKAVPKLQPIQRELEGYSLEGGTLTAYFQNGAPRKMVAKHYGEGGRATDELYFWNGRLFFVLRTDETYQKPIGTQSDTGVITRTQQRFYFSDGRLTKWIDENGQTLAKGNAFQEQQTQQLQFAREMLAGARATSKTIQAPR